MKTPASTTMVSLGPLGRFINTIRGRGAAASLGSSSSSIISGKHMASSNFEQVNSMVDSDGKLSIERSGGQCESYRQLSNDGGDVRMQPAKKQVRDG